VAITDINSEDRLVQQTFADHLAKFFDSESLSAYSAYAAGAEGTLGGTLERDMAMPVPQRVDSQRFLSGQVVVQ